MHQENTQSLEQLHEIIKPNQMKFDSLLVFALLYYMIFFFLNTTLFMLSQEFISSALMLRRFLNGSYSVEAIFCLSFKNKWHSFGKIQ